MVTLRRLASLNGRSSMPRGGSDIANAVCRVRCARVSFCRRIVGISGPVECLNGANSRRPDRFVGGGCALRRPSQPRLLVYELFSERY